MRISEVISQPDACNARLVNLLRLIVIDLLDDLRQGRQLIVIDLLDDLRQGCQLIAIDPLMPNPCTP